MEVEVRVRNVGLPTSSYTNRLAGKNRGTRRRVPEAFLAKRLFDPAPAYIRRAYYARLNGVCVGLILTSPYPTPAASFDLMRILVVEDEVRLSRHIASALTEEGHDPLVIHDGETALGQIEAEPFDLLLLDIGLPGMDGFEVLRRLRAKKMSHRVLVLTARGELSDRINGLQLGADDYLAKPFAMQELLARVRALGRRYAEEPEVTLRVGDLTLNLVNQEVDRAGDSIELSVRELTLLKVLMREPGRIFTRIELCERVWEREHEYDTKLVEVFVGRLRKKIGSPPLIHTIRHVGYAVGDSA